MKVYGLYIRTHDIWSPVIRGATWSKWSHVAFVTGNTAYEATFWNGYVKTTVGQVLARASKFEFVEYEADPRIVEFHEAQLGKDYDITAVFSLFFHRDWQELDKWFCSESFAMGFNFVGDPIINLPTNRVTPNDCYYSVKGRRLGEGVIPNELPIA